MFVMETRCVCLFIEVGTEFLNTIYFNSVLQKVKLLSQKYVCGN
jgi:hypothetical protein